MLRIDYPTEDTRSRLEKEKIKFFHLAQIFEKVELYKLICNNIYLLIGAVGRQLLFTVTEWHRP